MTEAARRAQAACRRGPRETGAAAPTRSAPRAPRRLRSARGPRRDGGATRAAVAPHQPSRLRYGGGVLGTRGTGERRGIVGPTRRQPVGTPGWNDKAAVAILVVCARHLLAVESPPLTPDRLAQLVAGYTFPQLVALFAQSPAARVREDAARLRRLVLAGQVVYHGVMHGLPVALGDPFFRLDLARAAARAGLDLFPSTRSGR
jgi:hypothetical protein